MTISALPLVPRRPTWLEIDRTALTSNVRLVRRRLAPQCQLMAVVKANAYGHGAPVTAITLLGAGVDRLAVATLAEAIELREAGVQAPILILGYTPHWLASELVHYQVMPTIFDLATARALAASAQAANRQAALHVKVNTGMNRLGLRPELVVGFLTELAALPTLKVEGIFTHFASADLADKGFAQEQLTRFVTLLRQLERVGLRPDLAHAANSAALLTMPESYLDMVRCGIALYGLHPDAVETPLPPEFRPALTWKAEVAHVSKLEAGERIGYGEEFVASQRMTVAVVPVGYADGFPRRPYHWNTVLIRGQPAPILGRVCMDQTIVDVSEICATQGEVCQGNEVVLLGRQGDRALDVEEIAARLHTNNYDVVSRIMARVPRIYVNQPEDV